MNNSIRTIYLNLPPEFYEIIIVRNTVLSWRRTAFERFPGGSFRDVYRSNMFWKLSIPEFTVHDWTMITNLLRDLILWKDIPRKQVWHANLEYIDHEQNEQKINFGLKSKEGKLILYIKKKEKFTDILGEHNINNSILITLSET